MTENTEETDVSADEIEAEIRSSMKTEISSQKIGEMVMEKLKNAANSKKRP